MDFIIAALIVLGFPVAIYVIVRILSSILNAPHNVKYNLNSEYRDQVDKERKEQEEFFKKQQEERDRVDRERRLKRNKDSELPF
ncbi:MAG: hypothetical protein AB1458_14440 [Bacteroidota bacterium]